MYNNSIRIDSYELPHSPLLYLPNLVRLSLYRPNIKDPQLLVDALKRLTNLEQLSLYCVECLNDNALIELLKNNGGQLTSLRLSGYMALPMQLTERSVKGITSHCTRLTKLGFDQFSTTLQFESLRGYFEQPLYAVKFEEINLSACRSIKFELLLEMALNCVNLKRLDLSGLTQLVNDELVETIARNATRLTWLDVKACTHVTDKSICLIATKCPLLEGLVLAGINSLTDKTIFTIANHLQASLREIYLSGCSKISDAALRYLTDMLANYLFSEHRCPNQNPNQIYAKNLDTGCFELLNF